MKNLSLVIILLSFIALPAMSDETDQTMEEIHNVIPTENPDEAALVNEDGLEYYDAETKDIIEGDLAGDPDQGLDEEDLDDDDFDEEDLDDDDFEDEDLDDDDFDDEDFGDDDFEDDDFDDDDF